MEPFMVARRAFVALSLAVLALAACGPKTPKASAPDTLTVAATAIPHAEVLEFIKPKLAAEGLKLEIKVFNDYVQPNTQVAEKRIDVSYFETLPYLENFNKEKGTTLIPIQGVHVEPIGAYSSKWKSIAEVPNGATVAIPNDGSTEGRSLILLAKNGVITLKDPKNALSTIRDITGNPKNLKFKELEAPQLPRSLDDVDAAVINGNYAIQAHLKPAKEALILESPDNSPYGNFLAVKKGNEDDPRIKKLAKLLTSPQVKKFIKDKYDGSVLASF